MNTKQATKFLSKANQKSLELCAGATALMLTSTSVLAAEGGFSSKIAQDRDAARSMVSGSGTGSAETGLGNVYEFIKWVAIIVGLVLAISGLLLVSKAAKSEGQRSQMPGWITFFIGGMMSVVGVLMFALGKTTVSVIGAEGGQKTSP